MKIFKVLAECFNNLEIGLIVAIIIGAWAGIMAALIPIAFIKYIFS